MRILLLNPNASAHITARMADSARSELREGDELVALTNEAGPPVVRDATGLARAEAMLPALMAPHLATCDAFVLAISLDGAIDSLRPAWGGRPAFGMTEAAVARAALDAARIGLLTIGPALAPLYAARLAALLPASRIAGVAAPELEAAFAPGEGVSEPVLQALVDAARALPADAYVLAGAVLCGYDTALQSAIGRPAFDGVRAAMQSIYGAARPA